MCEFIRMLPLPFRNVWIVNFMILHLATPFKIWPKNTSIRVKISRQKLSFKRYALFIYDIHKKEIKINFQLNKADNVKVKER